MELGQFWTATPGGFAWGSHKVVAIPNPAAGSNWEKVVPGGFYWRPVAAIFTYKASAAVGTRTVDLVIKNGQGVTLVHDVSKTGIAGSETVVTSIWRGGAENATLAKGPFSLPMPDVVLEPGWSIGTAVKGIEAEDQLEAITLWVEQFDVFTDEWQDMTERTYKVLLEIKEAMAGAASIN